MNTRETSIKENQSGPEQGGLIACQECDFLHRITPVPAGGKALCTRCGAFLYRKIPNSIERALALNLSAFMLFLMANFFPFLSLKASGRIEESFLLSGALALYRVGMGELGLLVFLTSFVFPLLIIGGMLYILFPLRFGYRAWKTGPVYRMVRSLMPWSLIAVFMLGVLIAIVKLRDLAAVIPGTSLFAFAGLMILLAAANANMDPALIWPSMKLEWEGVGTGVTAAERGLISCHTCALLVPKGDLDEHGRGACPRCGGPLHSRKTNSVMRTWALVITAAMLYIPANVYPVMTVIQFGRGSPNTILGGVMYLMEEGMYGLAIIILFASIVVPLLKLVVLSYLNISVQKKSSRRTRDRTRLFRVTEGVGAWSMVDIYVVALLVGLVNFGALSTVRAEIGATFFGAVVVITMFAAHLFDPRLIWDNSGRPK